MVMAFRQQPVAPDALAPMLYTPGAKGAFPAEMDAVIRSQGMLSYPVTDLDAVLQEVVAGNPVVVLQNLGLSWWPKWHYAVVVGYDLEQQELVLRSGNLARRKTPFKLFNTTWRRSNHWGRVIMLPSQVPATAEPLKYVRAALDIKQTHDLATAQLALEQAAQHWPDHPLVWFSWATVQLEAGQPDIALQGFQQLLQRQPDHVAGWNNLSYVFQALDCGQQAQWAAQCAASLAPDNSNVADTQRQMSSLTPNHQPACAVELHCPVSNN